MERGRCQLMFFLFFRFPNGSELAAEAQLSLLRPRGANTTTIVTLVFPITTTTTIITATTT